MRQPYVARKVRKRALISPGAVALGMRYGDPPASAFMVRAGGYDDLVGVRWVIIAAGANGAAGALSTGRPAGPAAAASYQRRRQPQRCSHRPGPAARRDP